VDYDSDTVFERDRTGRDPEVRNMFRHGKVIERIVDTTQVSCRVQYLDKDGLISKPLPVKQKGSKSTGSFYCPKIGDDVNVTMLANGSEDGFIDGSFYNAGNPPPTTNPDCHHTTYNDGTIIEYAESTSTRATGQLTIKSTNPIVITCGNMSITITGSVGITSSGQATIKAPAIVLDAIDVKITGKLWVDNIKPYQAAFTMATPKVANADGSGQGS
jgi:phage baseplate assembly protein V